MSMGGTLLGKPENLRCEAKACSYRAHFIYGPECEAETGKLMYLCRLHAAGIRAWMDEHPNDPTMCPTHGDIGPVKSYVILKEMT